KNETSIPVFTTAYQEFFNKNPVSVKDDFELETVLNDHKIIDLSQNEVVLKVKLNVKKEANYVMLQVPIPAGLDYYGDNLNQWSSNTYKEQLEQGTNFYFEHLGVGVYDLNIKLTPRFKGTYTLNPAKVELMYFPTFYGRESLKQVNIKD
ncbi:MAG: hypothetical protein ACRCVT_11125, partial [Leadbetterella sp.]